jgi:hypothetical protein
MQPDFFDLVKTAAERCWKSHSLEEAREILRPALEAKSINAYSYLVEFLIGLERLDEAKGYAATLLQEAKTDHDFVIICRMCRDETLSQLGFDARSIYRQTLLALADRGNPVFQTEMALNYLRGECGFRRDPREFEHWIQKAIDASEEIDPVCYFVEYLLEAGRQVEPRVVERLRLAAAAEPDRRELHTLHERAQKENRVTAQSSVSDNAATPNPSIERTSPGKPDAASHVKR